MSRGEIETVSASRRVPPLVAVPAALLLLSALAAWPATAQSLVVEKTHALPAAGTVLAVADFDGDGYKDVAAATSAPSVVVLYLDATGTEKSRRTLTGLPADGAPASISAAQFNGTRYDIAVGTDSHTSLFGNTGSGFSDPVDFSYSGGVAPVLVGKSYHEGVTHLVYCAGYQTTIDPWFRLNTWWRQSGSGPWELYDELKPVGQFGRERPLDLARADFDEDDSEEIVVATEQTVRILKHGTSGYPLYTKQINLFSSTAVGAVRVATGPLDGDTSPDIASITSTGRVNVHNVVYFPGNATPSIQFLNYFESGVTDAASIEIADINRDGAGDIIIGAGSGQISAFLGSTVAYGTYTAGPVVQVGSGTDGLRDVAVIDFDKDDYPDLAAVTSDGTSNRVTLVRNDPYAIVGLPIVAPAGAAESTPESVMLDDKGEPCDTTNWFYWSIVEKRIYPVCPVRVKLLWRIAGADPSSTDRIEQVVEAKWPSNPQKNIVGAPVSLGRSSPDLSYVSMVYPPGATQLAADKVFTASASGKNVFLFAKDGNPAGYPPTFLVAASATWQSELTDHAACTVGTPLTDASHDDPGYAGYVYFAKARYDASGAPPLHERATRVGPVIPVNLDTAAADDDMLVVWYATHPVTGTAWPVRPVRYDCAWPSSPPQINIASERGSDAGGALDPTVYRSMRIYHQPDPNLPGFNPNDEHALFAPSREFPGKQAVFALRSDIPSGSQPYVLLKYRNSSDEWAFRVYKVVDGLGTAGQLSYSGTAGTRVQAPYPLSVLAGCEATYFEGLPLWQDHKKQVWARSAGAVVARYFYPVTDLPWDSATYGAPNAENCVPWLDHVSGGTFGTPVKVSYTISWPANPPVLRIGQTLTTAISGLPDILHQAASEIIYDDADPDLADALSSLALLIDPLEPVSVELETLAGTIVTTSVAGVQAFDDLPPHLRSRLRYDPINKKLSFQGILDTTSSAGDPILLLNVISPRELAAIKALPGADSAFLTAVDELYVVSRNPREVDLDGDGDTEEELAIGFDKDEHDAPKRFRLLGRTGALTAGRPTGTGYLTLAFNNDTSLGALPVSLSVIRVDCCVGADCGPYQGQINVVAPENVFDEKLTLRHSGDFGGDPSALTFEWYTHDSSGGGTAPALPSLNPDGTIDDAKGWLTYASGPGMNDVTIEGASVLTLSDNWFLVRYKGYPFCSNATVPSRLAGAPGGASAQLAEGWIKRVLRSLNPFEARVTDFHKTQTATYASMLTIAGERYEGDIALNPDAANINSLGLIQTYETVLRRGMKLSVDGTPPINYPPANKALLNAAGRVADFYVLLGNEAFADAADPTIGYGTQSGEYGSLAPAIFSFQNQLDSLLDEELVLLRGRDHSSAPVTARPVYNRLFWNFTSGDGEVAYARNYAVSDQNSDGRIDETDARAMYPQGHGDAWGHYLTALTSYYRLMRNPNFAWEPRTEAVSVAGVPIEVGYLDERKFAAAAAALARTGSQLADLTYRREYVEDPSGQYQGYNDSDSDRAWGVVEWARRVGQGAYFNWAVANSILPDVDGYACSEHGLSPGTKIPGTDVICHSGISRIDRTTVTDIGEIAANAAEVQAQVDRADAGLNPLGLARNVVPFDIDPALVSSGRTHFEQIHDRAMAALNSSLTVFNYVNQLSLSLRRNQDTLTQFSSNVQQRDRDLRNRLIEIFGYPYADDIGPGKTYPTGYQDADIYHYMYADESELTGISAGETQEFTAFFKDVASNLLIWDPVLNPSGTLTAPDVEGELVKEVTYNTSVDDFPWLVKPESWTGSRRAAGELQIAISDILQQRAQYERSRLAYANHIKAIEDAKDDIDTGLQDAEDVMVVLGTKRDATIGLNALIGTLKGVELGLKRASAIADKVGEHGSEALPTVVGLATDVSSVLRSGLKTVAYSVSAALAIGGDIVEMAGNATTLAKEQVGLNAEIDLKEIEQRQAYANLVAALVTLLRQEPVLRLEALERLEALNQSIQKYATTLATGQRTLEELVRFRQSTASTIQQYRYEDMTFRVFRNDALQKYRAQFDLAARYTYLAAAAYDYETNLLGDANGSGREFLTTIVRQRGLGQVINGVPLAGSRGLADPLARMQQNFAVLKGQMGFTNPQTETNRFSLRSEWTRLRDSSGDAWRSELQSWYVADLWDVPEFRRYCRPFDLESSGPQPGLVIGPFATTVTSRLNFFGEPLGGGDSAYDPSHFATKIRSVGVWFGNYNVSGLSNTPRIYLVPVGADIMRSPSGDLSTREWQIIDQKIPVPFPIGISDLANEEWIPSANLSDRYADIRRFSSFRAYHDSGTFAEAEMSSDSRLIGRSVWNTRWLLIIPGATLHASAEYGLETFIDTVTDIKLFFQTYAYSGN